MSSKPIVKGWPERFITGAKRANIECDGAFIPDWFTGYGKDTSCQFEGTWWDMVCFARNVLASENTKIACPEFYQPALANENYTGEPPYIFEAEDE